MRFWEYFEYFEVPKFCEYWFQNKMHLGFFLELIQKNPELQTELLEFWEMSIHLENVMRDYCCTRLTNFEIDKYVFILKKIRLRDNWWGRDLLCSPSTTQHNFCFFTIRIFENCMSKRILKLTNMYLFWKRYVWEIIDEEEIHCARLAQLSTTFVL